jgi:hypothetical protein
MAHNHRMQGIADPYINQRNEMIAREQETRSRMQMPHASEGYASLEGRSQMQDPYDDENEEYNMTDEDLMPGSGAPINPAVRAYQESGHGVQVINPMDDKY